MTSNEHPTYDKNLTVQLTTSEAAYILGSCHTFPGRLLVWVPSDDRSRCVSKSDIVELSIEAHYWMQGFLHGSVPSPPEDPALDSEWASARIQFLETGEWPRG